MKVLLLNTFDIDGGAAIAVHRLYKGLLMTGAFVRYGVQVKKTVDRGVVVAGSTRGFIKIELSKYWDFLLRKIFKSVNNCYQSFNLTSTFDKKIIEVEKPDLIHLNWLGNNFLKPEDLSNISKPIVWTFHDMWPFLGSEHYIDDEKYNNSFWTGSQKHVSAFERWSWKRKYESWKQMKIVVVVPSRWMKEVASKSILFNKSRIEVIPNGLDVSCFKPKNKIKVRKLLDLPLDKKIILFGASGALVDKRKGFEYFKVAIEILLKDKDFKDKYVVTTFGSSNNLVIDGVEVINFGVINTVRQLVDIYNSSDVMCVPSKMESFGQTASESLACATPVVCFDTTGLKDIVDHKVNGYRAKPFDPFDFALGISYVLKNNLNGMMSKEARNTAVGKFDIRNITKQYIKLYKEVVRNGR